MERKNPEYEALYSNDPDNDYALVMEFWWRDQTFATVRKIRNGPIRTVFYPISESFDVPLDWLIEKLSDAHRTLSKPGTQ